MRVSSHALAAMLLVLVAFSQTTQAQQPKVLAPHRPLAPRLEKRLPWSKPTVRQSATGGLWMTDANWKAALYLKSGLKTDPVTVTPILYLSNGRRYPLPPVTLEPSGTAVVDIGKALESVGIAPYATLCGYAEIEYQWAWAAVSATVKNVDVVNSLIFIFGLQPTPDWHPEHMNSMPSTLPTSFEGLWWKQEKDVSGFLALSNVTGQPIHAAVRLTDKSDAQLASYQVTVSPHGTKKLTLNELKTAAGDTGGVYLTHDGPERGLDINGGLQDLAAGYSAQLRMRPQPEPSSSAQPQSPETLSISELGLMTGTADPMMNFPSGTVFTAYSLVRNISEQAATVTPELWWMAGGSPKSATLPQMTITPHQTVNLNVPALLAAAGLNNFNGSVNLILETKALAGGLMMSSGSVDQRNTYVFEVIAHGVAESAGKTLCYWSTGNGDDTMLVLWNPADEPEELAFTLFYTGGQYVYPIHLGPRETRTFNVSEISHSSIPDAAGSVIPAGITEGSAEIAGSLGEHQHILIGLDVGVYNVRKATCGTVCWECDGAVDAAIALSPFGVAVGGTTGETFYETYNTGYQYSMSASWSSSKTNIATVNSSGVVTGVKAGSLTLSAYDLYSETQGVGWYCTDMYFYCPTENFSAATPGNAVNSTPVITGIDPSDWTAGVTTNVAFTGQYFGTNAPTLSFSPGAGISYTLSSYNDTQIVALVKVAAGTPNEEVSVSVTNNGYNGSPFYAGSTGESPTSTPTNATVHAPIPNSPEVTVIAWINGNAPDLQVFPAGNQTLVQKLHNANNLVCGAELAFWAAGSPIDIQSSTDQDYANDWLIKYSANTAPPATITPSGQLSGGNFRMINDFGGSGPAFYRLGITPDPCGVLPNYVLNWIAQGQPSQYNGASGTSGSGKVYQLVEGRIGSTGQQVNLTLNNRTAPWVWTVIKFDSSGNPTYSEYAVFPTYSVYINGTLTNTYAQSPVSCFSGNNASSCFAGKDQTYQLTPSQIQ